MATGRRTGVYRDLRTPNRKPCLKLGRGNRIWRVVEGGERTGRGCLMIMRRMRMTTERGGWSSVGRGILSQAGHWAFARDLVESTVHSATSHDEHT